MAPWLIPSYKNGFFMCKAFFSYYAKNNGGKRIATRHLA
jgi:hypothetical protein